MGNPYCPKCKKPKPLLRRQRSGRRSLWVCPNKKGHRFTVGQALSFIEEEKEEKKK